MANHHHHEHSHYHLQANEHSTRIVVLISVVAMLLELFVGYSTGSVTLLMDGWHMLSHVLVLLLAWGAYIYIRLRKRELTHKKEQRVLGLSGFSSAIILLTITLLMMKEAVQNFSEPKITVGWESFAVAGFGLVVNGVSAFVLHREEEKMDASLYAAYIHVLSDVLLSIFAILALSGVYFRGWVWLDPLCGIIGSMIILQWSAGLIRRSWLEVMK